MKSEKAIQTIELRKLADHHWQTYTDIVIDAPMGLVWKWLCNWDALSQWSSTLKGIQGEAKNGASIRVTYFVEGTFYHTPHTLIYKEGLAFGWSDPMEGEFEGLRDNHFFSLQKIDDDKTLFIQSDDFKGSGVENISAEDLARSTLQFFPLFNSDLKKVVEENR